MQPGRVRPGDLARARASPTIVTLLAGIPTWGEPGSRSGLFALSYPDSVPGPLTEPAWDEHPGNFEW